MSKKLNTKMLCTEAIMAALFVVFDILATNFSGIFGGNIKFSLSGLPIIICSLLFGPVSGMLVGLVGAFASQMLTYGFTATTVLWILPAVARGLVTGWLFIALGKKLNFGYITLITIISSIIVTALNTLVGYIDSQVYGYPYAVFAMTTVTRFVTGVATAVIYSIILVPIVKQLKKHI